MLSRAKDKFKAGQIPTNRDMVAILQSSCGPSGSGRGCIFQFLHADPEGPLPCVDATDDLHKELIVNECIKFVTFVTMLEFAQKKELALENYDKSDQFVPAYSSLKFFYLHYREAGQQ